MPTHKKGIKIRLSRLEIENFKAIDHIEIDFNPPIMKSDPDIHVMGSCNGLGKTSILEACALLFICIHSNKSRYHIDYPTDLSDNISKLLIRSGKEKASITGVFSFQKESFKVQVQLIKCGRITVTGDVTKIRSVLPIQHPQNFKKLEHQFFMLLAGYNMEPVIIHPCLYFHSYRKIQEGNPDLGMLVDSDDWNRNMPIWPYRSRPAMIRNNPTISTFKSQILRALMGKANLFESLDGTHANETLEKLNSLLSRYANSTITKLRPSADSTVELRITPIDGGKSFNFDGLSSGQKEIISTLFMIWNSTKTQPGIILIDEPELHLNAGWHRNFVRQAFNLAPENQYIFATHSEDIFRSVDNDRRLFLSMQDKQSPATNTNGEYKP